MKSEDIKTVLTIAASDCGGGAGIQADIKTITVHGLYAASAVTALTAQNTTGVYGVVEAEPEFVARQIDLIFEDIRPDAVKIGMLGGRRTVEAVAERLAAHRAENVVLDPVMIASSGRRLLSEDAVGALTERLMPLCALVTPNIPEAEALSGLSIGGKEDMRRAAEVVARFRACSDGLAGPAVLIKGGHLSGDAGDAEDLLYQGGEERWFSAPRVDTKNSHGTGCTLSSAVACGLARGLDLTDSVAQAKAYLTGALAAGLDLGKGSGPLNHMWRL